MNNHTTITNTFNNKKKLSLINWINNSIEREKKNALGITLIYIMVGSGVASLTAALAVNGTVSLPILLTSACLVMATNCAVLSQQPFKISSWFFIVNIIVNIALLIYQIIIF